MNTLLKEPDSSAVISGLGVAATLVLGGVCFFSAGTLAAQAAFLPVGGAVLSKDSPGKVIGAVKEAAEKAALLDPLEARYRYELASAEWLKGKRDSALTGYLRSLRLSPASGKYLQSFGIAAEGAGREDAERFLRAGVDFERNNPARYARYAAWLMAHGRTEDASGQLRRAVLLEPEKTRNYIALMVLYGFDDREIGRALPDLTLPRLTFAEYLQGTGRDEMAAEEYRRALAISPGDRRAKSALERLK